MGADYGNSCFQDNRYTAKDYGDPCRIKGREKSRRLMMSAPPDMASSAISFLMLPASRNDSIIVIALFI